jgi:hypothetical protein
VARGQREGNEPRPNQNGIILQVRVSCAKPTLSGIVGQTRAFRGGVALDTLLTAR